MVVDADLTRFSTPAVLVLFKLESYVMWDVIRRETATHTQIYTWLYAYYKSLQL